MAWCHGVTPADPGQSPLARFSEIDMSRRGNGAPWGELPIPTMVVCPYGERYGKGISAERRSQDPPGRCGHRRPDVFGPLLVATGWRDQTPLGSPRYWPWLLTGLQVLALWSAGRGLWWGWLLGGSVQLRWIAHAVVTTQLGFMPGCAVSAAVQTHSFLRRRRSYTVPVVGSRPTAAKEEII